MTFLNPNHTCSSISNNSHYTNVGENRSGTSEAETQNLQFDGFLGPTPSSTTEFEHSDTVFKMFTSATLLSLSALAAKISLFWPLIAS